MRSTVPDRHRRGHLALVTVVTSAIIVSDCGGSQNAARSPAPTTSPSSVPVDPQRSVSPPRDSAPTTTVVSDMGSWTEVGRSVEDRPIRMKTVGHGDRVVLWVGGIHGDEPEGAVATAELPQAFIDADLADEVTLLIIEDLNPDGRAADTRANANGVDLNRNYPAESFDSSDPAFGGTPLSQPEAKTVHDVVVHERPDLVLVAHGWREDTFVNFDGPAEHIARRFSDLSGMRVKSSDNLGEETPGSLGSWIGRGRGTPILTIEYLRGSDATANWDLSRSAVLGAIAGA